MGLSRQGRRLSRPVPGWVGGLGGVILLAYGAAFAAATTHRAGAVNVAYEISGTGLADVELTSPDGGRVRLTRTAVPLRRDFVFHRGERAFVTVTAVGGGLVGCRLRIDAEVVAGRVGQSATCGGTIGDPQTYQPPPPTGPADAPAEADKIMKLPRYTGRSSPVTGRLTDRAAGISYARLGGAWGPPATDQEPGVHGRMLTLRQESRPERGWFALFGSGLMDPELLYRYQGDRRLLQAALAQQDALTWISSRDTSYRDVVSQPLTVDGRKAWVITRRLTLGPQAQTSIRTELHTLVLIDTGRQRPSYLFINMPDPSHDHLPDVNRLLSSIRVL